MKTILALMSVLVFFTSLNLSAHETEDLGICKVTMEAHPLFLKRNPETNKAYWDRCFTYSLKVDDHVVESQKICGDGSEIEKKYIRHASQLDADGKCTFLN
jgi:hypothetical protein